MLLWFWEIIHFGATCESSNHCMLECAQMLMKTIVYLFKLDLSQKQLPSISKSCPCKKILLKETYTYFVANLLQIETTKLISFGKQKLCTVFTLSWKNAVTLKTAACKDLRNTAYTAMRSNAQPVATSNFIHHLQT